PSLFQNTQLIIELPDQLRVACCPFTVALPQTVITKLAQITFARFAIRNGILRILGASKFKIEMTAFANFERVLNRLWKIPEYLAHFIRRFEIQLPAVAPSSFVLHHLTRGDTKHHVARLVIAPAQNRHIVSSDYPDAEMSRG